MLDCRAGSFPLSQLRARRNRERASAGLREPCRPTRGSSYGPPDQQPIASKPPPAPRLRCATGSRTSHLDS